MGENIYGQEEKKIMVQRHVFVLLPRTQYCRRILKGFKGPAPTQQHKTWYVCIQYFKVSAILCITG